MSKAGHTAVALFATNAVSCDKATAMWPAREATFDVANGGHTIYRSVGPLCSQLRLDVHDRQTSDTKTRIIA